MRHAGHRRPAAIVVGAGEIGSAVAVALHRAGCAVVLSDEVDPAWPRRGMAFTNAWYIGNAELDGEAAVFCASLRSLPSVLDRRGAIAATSWSWAGVAAALAPALIVDATRHGVTLPRAPRDAAPALTIAIAEASGVERSADVVVELVSDADATAPGITVPCPRTGRFATSRRIGDRVVAGEIVGGIGVLPIAAPCAGVLRGLSARGARVLEGAPLVEVDPRGNPVLCFGLDARAAATAREVVCAAAHHGVLARDIDLPAATDAAGAAIGA